MPFNIGPGELIIVLIIALIVVGPGKLPDVGASLGKSIREFRKAASDVKESTALDAPKAATPSAPTSAATPADAAPAAPPAPTLPPASPGATQPETAGPATASTQPETASAPKPAAEAAESAASEGEWPAEVTPVDDKQPTPSA